MNASSESGLWALTIPCGTDVIEDGGTTPVYTGMGWHGSRGIRGVLKNDEGGAPPGCGTRKVRHFILLRQKRNECKSATHSEGRNPFLLPVHCPAAQPPSSWSGSIVTSRRRLLQPAIGFS